MTTPAPEYDPQEWLDIARHLGVEVETVTDTFGRVDVRLDRTAMRAFRDAALRLGFADIAAVLSSAITPRSTK